MRTENEVSERFHEVYERELRRKLDEYLTTAPINCRYNSRYRVKGNGVMGFCGNPAILVQAGKPVFLCQDIETAKHCRCYECRNTESSATQEFIEELKSPSVCGQKYPKLAMLLWFMQKLPSSEQDTRRGRLWTLLKDWAKNIWDMTTFRWW